MRRNYFVPVPEAESFEELNRILLVRLLEDDKRLVPGKEMTIGRRGRWKSRSFDRCHDALISAA